MSGLLGEEPRKTLRTLRLVWAALVIETLTAAVLVAVLIRGQPPDPSMSGLAQASLGAAFLAAGLGYFVRQQTYKKRWLGDRIEPRGYFQGNLILLALVDAAALFALVAVYLTRDYSLAGLAAIVSMLFLALNFPSGRPMEPSGPALANR